MNPDVLKQILVDNNYVSAEAFAAAAANGSADYQAIVRDLIQQGLISKEVLNQATAEYYKMPYFDLGDHPPVKETVLMVDEALARKYHFILLQSTDVTAIIATDTPPTEELNQQLKTVFPTKAVQAVYASPESIDEALRLYAKTLTTRFAQIIKESKQLAPDIITQIFDDAIQLRTSDIHFEPLPEEVLIRFRVDGVLMEAGRFEYKYYENILNRIKVEAGLRIDEHSSTQDGSMQFKKDGITTDLRVSIVPTITGEKVVLRVLSRYIQNLALSDLGLSEKNADEVRRAAAKPFGMILLVGPTGAGKTTTLYALLKAISKPTVNVTTIEDPVEYRMEGINQIQVHEEKGLTFANGLRSIVRQDPDIILVGEIRDTETADISVNAALTGHLLLSTFHANDAATAVPRLIEMGIEPFLLASTLEIVVAARLVRRICTVCRYGERLTPELMNTFPPSIQTLLAGIETIYRGHGCTACNNTGYKGRIGVFECISTSEAVQKAVLDRANKQVFVDVAKAQGEGTLLSDGIDKVKAGITSVEEIVRVIGF